MPAEVKGQRSRVISDVDVLDEVADSRAVAVLVVVPGHTYTRRKKYDAVKVFF